LLTIDTTTDGTNARIALVGALTETDAEALKDTIESLLDDGYRAFELNMEGVLAIDSAGLGAIVRSHVSVTRRGGNLEIVGVREYIPRSFQLANLPILSWSKRMPRISERLRLPAGAALLMGICIVVMITFLRGCPPR
jgi:anti-anti-sigma factor